MSKSNAKINMKHVQLRNCLNMRFIGYLLSGDTIKLTFQDTTTKKKYFVVFFPSMNIDGDNVPPAWEHLTPHGALHVQN